MPTEPTHLAGLRPVTGHILEQFLARPNFDSRALPVVVALGPRGTGKTALLDAVRSRCQNLPNVYIDFGEHANARPREILGRLAFELSRHWPQFGRLAFPQLWLCLLVVGISVETPNRREVLAGLRVLLGRDRPIVENQDAVISLVKIAGHITGDGRLPGWAEPATDLLLRGLSWLDRRRLLREIQKLSTATGRPEDALIDIAKVADSDEDAADLEATFCEAFLGDLRRAYSGLDGWRRTLNCAVLLDNVHTPGGQAFLQALEQARKRSGAYDPMVVLATSRSWIHSWSDSWHRPGTHRTYPDGRRPPQEHRTGGLDYPAPRNPVEVEEDWSDSRTPERRWSPWYLLELGHLSQDQTSAIAAAHGVHPTGSQLPAFLHSLTAGHPAGLVDVVSAVPIADKLRSLEGLRDVLERPLRQHASSSPPSPNGVARTLLDVVREELLQDFEGDAIQRDLVTAAATRDVELLFLPKILHPASLHSQGRLFEALIDRLWLAEVPGSDEPMFELNPWLRRILLHDLALRDDDDPLNWTNLHTLCRDFYQRNRRLVQARYHDMALANVTACVAHLRQPFDDPHEFDLPTAEAWLADLDLITSAPNRLPTDQDPYVQMQEHAGHWSQDDLEANLAQLVVSLWISNDPLGDPGGRLDLTIARGYENLTPGQGQGSMQLLDRAAEYRRRAEAHSPGTVHAHPAPPVTEPDHPIKPPPPRWRKPALATAVILGVLAAIAVAGIVYWDGRTCGDGVVRRGEHSECTGVTDGETVFSSELERVQGLIHSENERVVASGEPYVSVVVLLPMTVVEDDIVSSEWVRHQLQGAHVAQVRANHTSSLGTPDRPSIRLLLANPGSRYGQWEPVLDELQSRRASENIVAVTGIGVSLKASRNATRRLSEEEMPVIGSTLPADDIGDLPGFLRVSPTNSEQARSAAQFLKDHDFRSAMLVQDISHGDLYPRTLARTFSKHFVDGEHPIVGRTERYNSSHPGVANTFLQMVPNICSSDPDVIYFAGRAGHLPAFIQQLTTRGCREEPLTIVTADDLSNVDIPDGTLRRAREANVTLIHTALAHPKSWAEAPDKFGTAARSFTEVHCGTCFATLFPNEPPDALDDGSAILSHDAVLTALWAARNSRTAEVTPQHILQVMNRLHGRQAVPGASGRLTFDDQGNPINKPVPILELVPGARPEFVGLTSEKG